MCIRDSVQLLRIVYAIVHREIILKAAVIFPGRLAAGDMFVSAGLKDGYRTQEIHVDVNMVRNDLLDLEAFRAWRPDAKK